MEEEGEEAHAGEGWGRLGLRNIKDKDEGNNVKETKNETNKKNENDNLLGGANNQDGPMDK